MTPPFQLFDALDPATEAALSESIQRFGVLVPVVKDQHGNTLDGHHRARIADGLGVKYRTDVVKVEDEDEARDIARTLNADRRHLSADQRREVVKALREQGHSLRSIGGALGVNHQTVANDLAELSSDRQLDEPERVIGKDGKSRPARKPTIVPAKNDREAERAQSALIDLGDDAPPTPLDVKRAERLAREKRAEERRQQPVPASENPAEVDLRHGDFRDCLDDLAGQVDAIITDPPYPAEFVPLFSDLSEAAARLLKPDGVLVAMVGQSHLPDYIERLSERLSYRWVGAYQTHGQHIRVHNRTVASGWKPLLVFHRDADAEQRFFLDIFKSTGDDKDHHVWGQSESGMASIVDRFAAPGQLVVDPFLGGGTTAVVCQALGIRFVGCDIDAACVHSARERVA